MFLYIPWFRAEAFEVPNPFGSAPISVHPFGLLVATGVVLGAWIARRKAEKDGLDALGDVLALAPHNRWQEMTEDDKQRAKWHGLFFRKQTPGNFMLRLRMNAGRTNARQFGAERLVGELKRLAERLGPRFAPSDTLVAMARDNTKFYS